MMGIIKLMVERKLCYHEFHGDFWHGIPSKYLRSMINPVNKLTMGELYDKTLGEKVYREKFGYTYRSIWESEFDQKCQQCENLKHFIQTHQVVTPL